MWTVHKFGGTSVGTADRLQRVADIIQAEIKSGQSKPCVVSSAMSSMVKSQGTTSRLLHAAEAVLKPDASPGFSEILDDLKSDHFKAAREAISSNSSLDILQQLEKDLEREFNHLESFMLALSTIEEVSLRSRDIIMGFGEKLACRILRAVLATKNIPAKYVSLEKAIDRRFRGKLNQEFYDYLAKRIATLVEIQSPDAIPIVTGFFGLMESSILDSVGRGYSDLTAALLAVGLHANELQIWKEVDGVFTADPRSVPSAILLHSISPDEAAELTYYGSEVIHPFTMQQVIQAQIPIRIRNTFNLNGPGTVIQPKYKDTITTRSHKMATAITTKDPVVVLNVQSNKQLHSHGFFAQIFSIMDKHGLVVDLISTSQVNISMAISTESISEDDLEQCIVDLKEYGEVEITKNMAIISLVGNDMKNCIGLSAKLFGVLAKVGVNIEMISQGATEINLSCVIASSMSLIAMQAIHDAILI